MKIAQRLPGNVGTAIHALRQNKLRAVLTILGIVIGVAAVIAMVEIGNGSAAAIQQTISSMGANNIMVTPGQAASAGVSFGAGSTNTLTAEDSQAISENDLPIRGASPVVRVRSQVVYGNRNWVPQSIYGTSAEYLAVRDWTDLASGEPFTERDVRNGNRVCLVGQTIANELFPGDSPLGRELRIKNVPFRLVGVLRAKGTNMMGMDQDDIVICPWTAIKYRLSNSASGSTQGAVSASSELNALYPSTGVSLYPAQSAAQAAANPLSRRMANVDQIVLAAASANDIPETLEQVEALLRERHRLGPADPSDFTLRDMTEMTRVMTQTATVMRNLLLCVSLISLIVGGVGIMNIMLVSVTERTREIGIRIAVGATQRDIARQFLVEAIVLCLVGGTIGVFLGRGCSMVVSLILGWPTKISLTAICAAVFVSILVGVVFGLYPAKKAARLNPIEALRYE